MVMRCGGLLLGCVLYLALLLGAVRASWGSAALIGFALLAFFVWLVHEIAARIAIRKAMGLRKTKDFPAVSLIKPVAGMSEHTAECFRSWLEQDYPGTVQVIFSLQDARDPALALLEDLRVKEGYRNFQVTVNPLIPGLHGKSSNLRHGLDLAEHDILVFSDADILARPDTLATLVARIEDGADVAACLVRHTRPASFWGRAHAAIWNMAALHVCALWQFLDFGPCTPGGTQAMTRDALARLGGIEAFGGFLAEDLALGLRARAIGLTLRSGGLVESPVGALPWKTYWQKMLRGQLVYGLLEPHPWVQIAANALTASTLALVLIALATGDVGLMRFMAFAVLVRAIVWGILCRHSEGRFRLAFDFLVLEAVVLAAGLATALSKRCQWGGVTLEIGEGGRIRSASAQGAGVPASGRGTASAGEADLLAAAASSPGNARPSL